MKKMYIYLEILLSIYFLCSCAKERSILSTYVPILLRTRIWFFFFFKYFWSKSPTMTKSNTNLLSTTLLILYRNNEGKKTSLIKKKKNDVYICYHIDKVNLFKASCLFVFFFTFAKSWDLISRPLEKLKVRSHVILSNFHRKFKNKIFLNSSLNIY